MNLVLGLGHSIFRAPCVFLKFATDAPGLALASPPRLQLCALNGFPLGRFLNFEGRSARSFARISDISGSKVAGKRSTYFLVSFFMFCLRLFARPSVRPSIRPSVTSHIRRRSSFPSRLVISSSSPMLCLIASSRPLCMSTDAIMAPPKMMKRAMTKSPMESVPKALYSTVNISSGSQESTLVEKEKRPENLASWPLGTRKKKHESFRL